MLFRRAAQLAGTLQNLAHRLRHIVIADPHVVPDLMDAVNLTLACLMALKADALVSFDAGFPENRPYGDPDAQFVSQLRQHFPLVTRHRPVTLVCTTMRPREHIATHTWFQPASTPDTPAVARPVVDLHVSPPDDSLRVPAVCAVAEDSSAPVVASTTEHPERVTFTGVPGGSDTSTSGEESPGEESPQPGFAAKCPRRL